MIPKAWEFQKLPEHEKNEKSSKSRKERRWLDAFLRCWNTTLKAVTSTHHMGSWRQKGLFYPDYSPTLLGKKGLICNHQRNVDRLEMGLHSIILIRIKDLFWRSFLDFFLPALLSPNEAICIHRTSEADMNQTVRKHTFQAQWPKLRIWMLPGFLYMQNLVLREELSPRITSTVNVLMQEKCNVRGLHELVIQVCHHGGVTARGQGFLECLWTQC
jgi:hypothetical protein